MANVTVIRGKGRRPAEEHRDTRKRIEEKLQHISELHTNISMGERHVSLALGGILAGLAIGSRRPFTGGILGSLGAYLLARGVTGHCQLYEVLGMQTCDEHHEECGPEVDEERRQRTTHHDIVDEASEESMIASDPPSYTPTTGTGGQ